MSPRLPQRSERVRSWRGWLIPAALLALTPKCALCLLAYAGLGALFGVGGSELCGGADSAPGHWVLLILTGILLFGLRQILRRLWQWHHA
ncbi:MAG TPA: hypothetical protein VGM64_18875 [Lacunisphaera sp.]